MNGSMPTCGLSDRKSRTIEERIEALYVSLNDISNRDIRGTIKNHLNSAILAERETCAEIAENVYIGGINRGMEPLITVGKEIAQAIRNRSEK